MDCQVEQRYKRHGEVDPQVVAKHSHEAVRPASHEVYKQQSAPSISSVAKLLGQQQPHTYDQRKPIAEEVGRIQRHLRQGSFIVH